MNILFFVEKKEKKPIKLTGLRQQKKKKIISNKCRIKKKLFAMNVICCVYKCTYI